MDSIHGRSVKLLATANGVREESVAKVDIP